VSLLKMYMLPFSWPEAVKRPSALWEKSTKMCDTTQGAETYQVYT
jgi:hypothetical protein